MSGRSLDPNEFDQEMVATLRREAKAALRKRLGSVRRALPVAAAAERSSRIVSKLLQHAWLGVARGVALYSAVSARREPDLTELHQCLQQRGVRLYYPFMDSIPNGYLTGFRLWRPGDIMKPGSFSFVEPDRDAPLARRGDVDVVVVPVLGVTLDGHRLGSGSGFYDATLSDLCPPGKSIAVAYDFQCLVELPTEPHDLPCDDVVTDTIR